MEDIAVTNFRRFLRINTVHPTPDYGHLGYQIESDQVRASTFCARWAQSSNATSK